MDYFLYVFVPNIKGVMTFLTFASGLGTLICLVLFGIFTAEKEESLLEQVKPYLKWSGLVFLVALTVGIFLPSNYQLSSMRSNKRIEQIRRF